MNKKGTFVAVFVAGLFLVGLFEIGESFGAAAAELTRSHTGGGVTVKVTYLNPKGADDVQFQVVLDTHSADLDGYDLNTLSFLRDDTGKTYQATRVRNNGSGHHREVVLTFPKASMGAKRLELVIRDIAGVKGRSFIWDL